MNTETPTDVPLANAVLCWNDCEGDSCDGFSDEPCAPAPPLVLHVDGSASGKENESCAVFGHWPDLTEEQQLIHLMRDAWLAVVRYEVDAKQMHDALLSVPEFRAILPEDDVAAKRAAIRAEYAF